MTKTKHHYSFQEMTGTVCVLPQAHTVIKSCAVWVWSWVCKINELQSPSSTSFTALVTTSLTPWMLLVQHVCEHLIGVLSLLLKISLSFCSNYLRQVPVTEEKLYQVQKVLLHDCGWRCILMKGISNLFYYVGKDRNINTFDILTEF